MSRLSIVFVIFISLCLVSTPYLVLSSDDQPEQTVWSNSGDIFLKTLSSPAKGTWAGYSITIGFAGATWWALQNDISWYNSIQDLRSDWQDKVIPPINLLGDGLFHLGAYAALYKFGTSYDQRVAAMALEGQINVAIISVLIKSISSSPRPAPGQQEREWFTFKFSNNSFPSGHTMTAFCAAAIFGQSYHCEWLTYPLAGIVGYARIYSQRHWPADVIVGAGLGLLIGHTVLAFHQNDPGTQEPGVRFSIEPDKDGGKVVMSWHY